MSFFINKGRMWAAPTVKAKGAAGGSRWPLQGRWLLYKRPLLLTGATQRLRRRRELRPELRRPGEARDCSHCLGC